MCQCPPWTTQEPSVEFARSFLQFVYDLLQRLLVTDLYGLRTVHAESSFRAGDWLPRLQSSVVESDDDDDVVQSSSTVLEFVYRDIRRYVNVTE